MNAFFEKLTIKKTVILLAIVTTIFRAVCAFLLELGNDEVYYWCYAMFPSLSHFDHPPMVGLLIQTTTGGMIFDSELFIRLSSVLIGGINTWLMYIICRMIKSELTGLYAALLYTASIYCSVIVGTMIMPDTPLSTFFLLSMYFMHEKLIVQNRSYDEGVTHIHNHALILAGIFTGLAMISKYTAVFLWIGYGLYILLFDRREFKNVHLYVALLLTVVFFLPVLIWNYNNDFISFSFHQARTQGFEGFNLLYFGREILGAFFYNNPVNVVLLVTALWSYRKVKFLRKDQMRLLLLLSLPMIFTFLILSTFKQTLPHWSAPAYFPLMIITAAYLAEINRDSEEKFPNVLKFGVGFTAAVMILGTIQINTGFIDFSGRTGGDISGKDDITLDMYGWKQLGAGFKEIRTMDLKAGKMPESSYILAENWFPAAHYDYYVGNPALTDVKTIGTLDRTHKYAWITEQRGGIRKGDYAYYIESSRYEDKAKDIAEKYFDSYEFVKRIYITRRNIRVMYYDIYRLKNLIHLPEKELVCGHRPAATSPCPPPKTEDNELKLLNN